MKTLKPVLIFFISGLGSGGLSGWLFSITRLTSFWFRRSDKFLIPTYRYYAGFSILLLSGLAVAYIVSLTRSWIEGPLTRSAFRHITCALLIALSAPAIFAIFTIDPDFFESPAWFFAGAIAFLCLISAACWILTSRLDYQGVLINLLTLPAAITLLFLLVNLNIGGERSVILTYPIYDSLVAAACGYWIARNSRRRVR